MPDDRDILISQWIDADKALKDAKALEWERRKAAFGALFPTPSEGINSVELGNGYHFKAQYPFNYKLANREAVEAALSNFASISNEAAYAADRLVRFKPDLSISEYRKLSEVTNGDKMKALIDSVLTISPGAPQLELVAPKSGK